ncbi:MAG: class I SAM-dependent methyltransferase, partial [Proteobacteria bacterium]|nr:class I SAM-dependent methyltransferase [Pseudomonadota bacterium]
KHYLKHNNFIKDPGYRKFLSKLSEPLKKYISINDFGLDYGCGYAPALADIFKEDGFIIDIYDPFFFPNENVFLNKYNFITCSEVFEHLFNPYDEFFKLDALLECNGYLGVMTSFMPSDQEFEDWYYRRDPTHVVFYNEKTFEVIASQMEWNLIIPSKDIIIFKK